MTKTLPKTLPVGNFSRDISEPGALFFKKKTLATVEDAELERLDSGILNYCKPLLNPSQELSSAFFKLKVKVQPSLWDGSGHPPVHMSQRIDAPQRTPSTQYAR
eukprot:EG_transcript_26380